MNLDLQPLGALAGFGARLMAEPGTNARAIVEHLEAFPRSLLDQLNASGGLLVLPAMHGLRDEPELLVRLSRLCGSAVENYRETLTAANMIHLQVPEVLVLSNQPPCNREPPARPDPALTAEGALPVQFPHRRGWHTDQSFRRPPPDISLFYAVAPCPRGQGQTLFADGAGAYAALDDDAKARLDGLQGLHALLGTGRSEDSVRNRVEPRPLLAHQRSQRQPVARVHPETGRKAIYLCEAGQMDWLDGPLVGLEPGPNGAGAKLLYELMSHTTQPAFVYVHDWNPGDLVIYDNRCLLHAATWYDSAVHGRVMWRTTVMGNPGPEYANDTPSWVAQDGSAPMQGLEDLKGRVDAEGIIRR